MSKQKLLDILDPMPFGQYKGTLVGTVIEDDPDYIRWMLDETDWRLNEAALRYLSDQ